MSFPVSNPFSSAVQQSGHKYTFQLQLRKLHVSPSLPFDIKIVWARGQQRIQSQNIIKLQPPQNEINLHECFCNKSTVLFNKKTLQFRKKQSKIQIILYANGSPKQGGQYILNLCEILDPFNIKKSQQKIYRVITRNQKPHCQIQFKLTADYCQQMIKDQQRSIGSGIASISSKNTTNLTNLTNLTNMTNIIQSQQKNYVQKKNLFLYQAPSKDNVSVTSYTSYNTGIMRYGSSNKPRDQSTTSLKKQSNNIQKRQSIDMFNKNTNLKSNISQQYDLKSKNGSYNRYTQNNINNNFDNKTQNFDNINNKQLIDEQSKRSKLQAEVSKLNIYVKQQSIKLTQYITQNTKLKDQLNRLSNQQSINKPNLQSIKNNYEQNIQKYKKQNNDLHNRTYELNNQNRQLHRKYDNQNQQKQRIQQDLRRTRLQKQRIQSKLQTINRNMQSIITNKQQSTKQLQNLRDQLQHIRSLNMNLRQVLQKQRKKNQQLEYNKQYQINIQQVNKKKQQKLYDLQKQYNILRGQLHEKDNQIQNKKQLLYRLEKTNQQYKNKIMYSQNQKNNIFEQNNKLKYQNQKIKRQLLQYNQNNSKIRDQKTAQYQQKNIQLQALNFQYQQKIRNMQYQIQQNKKSYQQIIGLNQTIKRQLQDKKTQIYRLQNNIKGLRQFQNKFYSVDKILIQKQRQLALVKQDNNKIVYRINQLEQLTRKLHQQIQVNQRKYKQKQSPHSNIDVNQILRESVQMQVQLKFKSDQLMKLRNIQEKYQQIKYQIEIQIRNKTQLQTQINRLQRQLKQKNKFYLIEVEKCKLLTKQKIQIQKQLQKIKLQLKHCQQIIFNGDKQVKQMSQHIQYLQSQNHKLIHSLQSIQKQLSFSRNKINQISKFQNRIKQLESLLSERNYTINLLTTNLSNSQKQIQQLSYFVKNKQIQIQQTKKSQNNTSMKLIQIQQTKNVINSQLQKVITQKKNIQIKNQLIMQQLHSLKKQFQQQKGRSTSIVSLRSSEEQLKIRQLQNQLEKKDKIISKLNKQKLQIEQENINLHVQVMKKLSQMEKNKQGSDKIIYLTTKGDEK